MKAVKLHLVVSIIWCALISTQSAWADFYADPEGIIILSGGKTILIVNIKNSITDADLKDMVALHDKIKSIMKTEPTFFFQLDSTGGNVEAALKIGRYIRKLGAPVTVSKDAMCFSSCVFVLAGGATRTVEGVVGIHRPYEANDQKMSETQQKAKYDIISKHVVAYLNEMHVSTRIYEDSLFVSPENIKVLDKNELLSYGLSANDPYIEEAQSVQEAKNIGISRKELGARKIRADENCPYPTADKEILTYYDCRNSILRGSQ